MESKLYGISGTAHYGVILGANPSKGAKSPHLWNAVFRAFEIDAVFGAYDVVEPELGQVLKELKADPNFIGGAVGAPYKSAILPFLDEVEAECGRIGAVNTLYRKNGKLVGANTDGAGAVASLFQFLKDSDGFQGEPILVLGAGGAGKAVATYLARSCGSGGVIRLCNRDLAKAKELVQAIRCYGGFIETVTLAELEKILPQTELIVNCTSVGASDASLNDNDKLLNVLSTPLAPVPAAREIGGTKAWSSKPFEENISKSLALLAMLPPCAIVYDIIYRPAVTMLLKISESLGLRCLGGRGMNLEQAVIACHGALSQSPLWKPEYSADAIRQIMAQVP